MSVVSSLLNPYVLGIVLASQTLSTRNSDTTKAIPFTKTSFEGLLEDLDEFTAFENIEFDGRTIRADVVNNPFNKNLKSNPYEVENFKETIKKMTDAELISTLKGVLDSQLFMVRNRRFVATISNKDTLDAIIEILERLGLGSRYKTDNKHLFIDLSSKTPLI